MWPTPCSPASTSGPGHENRSSVLEPLGVVAMADSLFVGIDGGGTNCRARLRDARGTLLGEGRGGPANVRLGGETVMASILTACRTAFATAGLAETDFRRAHVGLGLAGAIGPDDGTLLAGHPFASAVLDTDAYTAWLGAFRGGPGAILIIGTAPAASGSSTGSRFTSAAGAT